MKNKFLKISFAIAALAIGIASCETSNPTPEKTVSELQTPEKIISFNKAVDEYNNFYNTRIAPFKGKPNQDETRAVWFGLEALENYLQKIETASAEKGMEVSDIGFILGVDDNNKRTVLIAPMSLHPKTGLKMPFSFDNDQITFLDNNVLDKYSNLTDFSNLTSTNQSLVLSTGGYIATNKTVEMYNRYYDVKVAPLSNIVENDTRICFYKKGILENYLTYLKNQAIDNNITLSGINIVFGVYGNNPTLGKEYTNHQTLFLAPTISGHKNSSNKSYSMQGEDILVINFAQNTLNKILSKSENTEISSLANEFGSSPPIGG